MAVHATPRLDSRPFLWGAATSAYQVEGNSNANDWHDWERRADTVCVEPAGVACDHATRYPEDIGLLADVGLNCYRFSMEWSRIEPERGRFSDVWLRHYRRVLETCHANGLLPILTLHHFTNPLWIAADGAWENPETARHFARYCRRVLQELGDLVSVLIPINEPNIPPLFGYEQGLFPPGKRDPAARARATEVFVEAHRLAVATAREFIPTVPVGMALAMNDWQAVGGGEHHRDELRRLQEDVFLDATDGDDFVGVNTYTRHRLGADGAVMQPEAGVELTTMGYEFWPEALGATLRRAHEYTGGRTLVVTEAGVAADDDTRRIEYVERSIAAMDAARDDGADVRGFLYWSALDNFEWQIGYGPRFGLIGVDRVTQERRVKESARVLGAIARAAEADLESAAAS